MRGGENDRGQKARYREEAASSETHRGPILDSANGEEGGREEKKKEGRVFGTSRVEEFSLTCWKITRRDQGEKA